MGSRAKATDNIKVMARDGISSMSAIVSMVSSIHRKADRKGKASKDVRATAASASGTSAIVSVTASAIVTVMGSTRNRIATANNPRRKVRKMAVPRLLRRRSVR